jgi:hypothetical protein
MNVETGNFNYNINRAPDLLVSGDFALNNLNKASLKDIRAAMQRVDSWFHPRKMMVSANTFNIRKVPKPGENTHAETIIGSEIIEVKAEAQKEGEGFSKVNTAEELLDVVVTYQNAAYMIGANIYLSKPALERQINLANSSAFFDRAQEVLGDMTLSSKLGANEMALQELNDMTLAFFFSRFSFSLDLIMQYVIAMNELHYPKSHFAKAEADLEENDQTNEHRRALDKYLRRKELFGKNATPEQHKITLKAMEDLIKNQAGLSINQTIAEAEKRLPELKIRGQESKKTYGNLLKKKILWPLGKEVIN